MVRQLEGQRAGWLDSWMVRGLDGQRAGWSDSWMIRGLDGQTAGWSEGWMVIEYQRKSLFSDLDRTEQVIL